MMFIYNMTYRFALIKVNLFPDIELALLFVEHQCGKENGLADMIYIKSLWMLITLRPRSPRLLLAV